MNDETSDELKVDARIVATFVSNYATRLATATAKIEALEAKLAASKPDLNTISRCDVVRSKDRSRVLPGQK